MTDSQNTTTVAASTATSPQPDKTPIVVYTEEQDTNLGLALAALGDTTPTDATKRTLRHFVHKYIVVINDALQKGHTTKAVCDEFNKQLNAELNINTFRAYVAAENYVPKLDASGNPIPRAKRAAKVVDTKSAPKQKKAAKPKAQASTTQAASPTTQAVQPVSQSATPTTQVVQSSNNANTHREV